MKYGFYFYTETGAIFYWNGEIEIISYTTNFQWTKVPEWINIFKEGNFESKFLFLGE